MSWPILSEATFERHVMRCIIDNLGIMVHVDPMLNVPGQTRVLIKSPLVQLDSVALQRDICDHSIIPMDQHITVEVKQ
jgi:hypothetical protein